MGLDRSRDGANETWGWFSELRQLLRRTPKKEQARTLQQKIREVETECRTALQRIEQGDSSELLAVLEEVALKFGGREQREAIQETRARITAMQEESDALQRIRQDAGADHDEAVHGYEEYLRRHPESSLAYLYLGGALEKAGDWEGCIAAYRQLVGLADSTSELLAARMQLGHALHRKGELSDAVTELRRAIECGTGDHETLLAPVYLYLGDALHDQGDLNGARAAWQEVTRTDTAGFAGEEAERRLQGLPASGEGHGD
jgi:tetratricopeptide (TPR) repeat protein